MEENKEEIRADITLPTPDAVIESPEIVDSTRFGHQIEKTGDIETQQEIINETVEE